MWDMDWRAIFELWRNMRNHKVLVWTEYCKKFKLLYIYFKGNMTCSSSLCERLRVFPTHHLKGILNCPISVDYHLDLHIVVTFY